MKKTLIALTVTSFFSVSSLAASIADYEYFSTEDAVNHVKKLEQQGATVERVTIDGHELNAWTITKDGKTAYIGSYNKDMNNGTITVIDTEGEVHAVRTENGNIVKVNGNSAHKNAIIDNNNKVMDEINNPDFDVYDAADVVDAAKEYLNENNLVVNDHGQIFDSKGEQVGQIANTEEGGAKVIAFGEDGKEQHISVDAHEEGQVKVKVENKSIPAPKPLPDRNVKVEDLHDVAAEAYREATVAYNNLDSKIESNTSRINNLEQDMKAMGNKMLDLEDRMDGVVATSHAVTNARPMVQDAGEFAMGVGMGAAGSKQALAIGGAYQFNANWSSSMTVNYETAGKRSNSQLSAGAGVQYRFK